MSVTSLSFSQSSYHLFLLKNVLFHVALSICLGENQMFLPINFILKCLYQKLVGIKKKRTKGHSLNIQKKNVQFLQQLNKYEVKPHLVYKQASFKNNNGLPKRSVLYIVNMSINWYKISREQFISYASKALKMFTLLTSYYSISRNASQEVNP